MTYTRMPVVQTSVRLRQEDQNFETSMEMSQTKQGADGEKKEGREGRGGREGEQSQSYR